MHKHRMGPSLSILLALTVLAGCATDPSTNYSTNIGNLNREFAATPNMAPEDREAKVRAVQSTYCADRAHMYGSDANGHLAIDFGLALGGGIALGAGTTMAAVAAVMGDGHPKTTYAQGAVVSLALGGALLGLRAIINWSELSGRERVHAASLKDDAATLTMRNPIQTGTVGAMKKDDAATRKSLDDAFTHCTTTSTTEVWSGVTVSNPSTNH